jgi:hypothetical protein
MLMCAEDNSGFILSHATMTYCGTEWLIGINVATGWFIRKKKEILII